LVCGFVVTKSSEIYYKNPKLYLRAVGLAIELCDAGAAILATQTCAGTGHQSGICKDKWKRFIINRGLSIKITQKVAETSSILNSNI